MDQVKIFLTQKQAEWKLVRVKKRNEKGQGDNWLSENMLSVKPDWVKIG